MIEQAELRSRGRSTLGVNVHEEYVKNKRLNDTTPVRNNRSLSRNSHSNLLQQAIQNNNFRTSSPAPDPSQRSALIRSLDRTRTKNIPMDLNVKPAMRRWNSIQYLPNEEQLQPPSPSEGSHNSISPLTVMKDQYDTKRPVSNVASVDNLYKDLDTPESPQMLRSEDYKVNTNNTTPNPSITNKIYNKMVKLIHGNGTVEQSESNMTMKYQSELDDDSEEDAINEAENIDSWASPTVNVSEALDVVDLENIMSEINDFQNNFVQKQNHPTPQTESHHASRIQQKILDYKDLYNQDDISKNSSYFSLNLISSSNVPSVFTDHNFKIQHETIMQQYSQVRLRFSDLTDFNLYVVDNKLLSKNDRPKQYLKSNVGPLGFLNRKNVAKERCSEDSEWKRIEQIHGTSAGIDKDLVNKIWSNEMNSLFPSEPTTPKPAHFQVGSQSSSQQSHHLHNHSHSALSQVSSHNNSQVNSLIALAHPSPILTQRPSFDVTQNNSFSVMASKVKFSD